MLLSKALKMQQDTEDRRNEVIIEGLEDKIKKLKESLKKKMACCNQPKVPSQKCGLIMIS
jgi:translation initiation factor 1 (eIF-1/SUI1)